MKKLCAKQNRRAKQWEFSQSVRKLFAMCCEFRNAKNHSEFRNAKTTLQISQCETPHCEFRNAKFHSEFRNAKTTLQISQCEKKISQCQMVANCLRKFMFCFFFFFFSSDFQYMLQNLHKTSKIKARKIA